MLEHGFSCFRILGKQHQLLSDLLKVIGPSRGLKMRAGACLCRPNRRIGSSFQDPSDFVFFYPPGDGGIGIPFEKNGTAHREGPEKLGRYDRAGPVGSQGNDMDIGGRKTGSEAVRGGETRKTDIAVLGSDSGL